MANSFGKLFKITTWGESHGPAVGVVIDGCPAGIRLSEDDVFNELLRRRTAQSKISSPRKESDRPKILSGVFGGVTIGTPISIIIENKDAKPYHYDNIKNIYRPGHADFTWEAKYGIRDWRGGGRASARETIGRVAAGAVAKKILKKIGIEVVGYVSKIGEIELDDKRLNNIRSKKKIQELKEKIERSIVRCPDETTSGEMVKLIEDVRKAGDSVGGVVEVISFGVPAGLGEPVFDKLSSDLARAVMSIPAVKGFETGSGFKCAQMLGSEHNDLFKKVYESSGFMRVQTETNNAGGVLGGISNGMPIVIRAAFKPVSSISQKQEVIDKNGNKKIISIKGRHDPCVVPRAVVIVESMVSLVLADHYLRSLSDKL